MTLFAGFQSVGAAIQSANPGDFYGAPEYNAGRGAISDPNGTGIMIGTACWGILNTNNSQVTQLYTSGAPFAGIVVRSQSEVWADASVPLGYSMTIPPHGSLEYFIKGSFYVIATSLNSGGVIVQGDIIVQNNTTGVLYSQTSLTIPSGYVQIPGYVVINPAPLSTTSPAPTNATGLVVISNIETF